ncbi:MAG: DUF4185 domain-containing protein [Proteobacteria bacterium]|nr:DUF4185 domain-containing protein [Pseudomonadota bacterium]
MLAQRTSLNAVMAIAVSLCAIAVSPRAHAATLSVVGSSAKVCQLTGETDWLSGAPTNAQTLSRYGLMGIDLGFPVESDTGALYMLFGDAVPPRHPPGSLPTVPPDDALGVTTRTAAPDAKDCLGMTFAGSVRRGWLAHPVVAPAIQQGGFNVPTGGVYVGARFFAFFWTNHCLIPDGFGPSPATPLTLPAASAHCFEIPANNSLGSSVLAYATDANPLAFTQVSPPARRPIAMPNGFVYVTAAMPAPRRRGVDYIRGYVPDIPVFGVARYRMSIPYLAMAPQATFGNVTTWRYYGGAGPSGPIWLTYQQWQAGQGGAQWSPPAGAELYANSPNPLSASGDERCVGEHSVTWNEPLGVWLMLYTCGGAQVEARTAPAPWGPWSAPTMLLSVAQQPSFICTLLWGPPATACPGRVSQQIPALTFGYLYAPFVLNRFTQNTGPHPGGVREASIYWTLSTWDPYQVDVMHSTLRLGP